MKSYSLGRAADRKALAARLAEAFARVEGVTVTNEPHEFDPRELCLRVSAGGATCSVDIDGGSTWGVLAHWNLDYKLRNGRLFTGAFQSLCGMGAQGRHGHHKVTGPAMGECRRGCVIGETEADIFAATINRAMRNVLSGSAFEQEQGPAA